VADDAALAILQEINERLGRDEGDEWALLYARNRQPRRRSRPLAERPRPVQGRPYGGRPAGRQEEGRPMMELPADELLDYLVSDDYLDAQRQQERNRDQPPAVPVDPASEPTLIRAAPDPAEVAALENVLTVARDGIRILAAPALTGVAALDELRKAAAAKPARHRRRWWWPW
jgi:hypothetical protein